MPNDSSLLAFVAAGADLLATYLIHSSLLLGSVWLTLRVARCRSGFLVEWLWKTAAVIPLVTAPLLVLGGWGTPIVSLRWMSDAVTTEEPDTAPASHTLVLRSFEPANGPKDETKFDIAAHEVMLPKPDRFVPRPVPTDRIESEPSSEQELVLATEAKPLLAPSRVATRTAPPVPSHPLPLLAGALVVVAAAVMVMGLLRLSLQWLAFRRRMRACCVATEGNLAAALERILSQASISRRVRLLVSPALDGPGAFGLFHWSVVVPAGVDAHLNPHELRALLAHEVAHLVRGDARWLWIGRLLCFCLPIQPLNFLARRGWQAAAEFQCDDWAVRQRVQGFDLARCLTRIVELRLANAPRSLALSAIGSESRLTQRIERMLEAPSAPDPWERRARVLRGAALLCFVVLGVCGPRSALLARDAESVPETPMAAPKRETKSPVIVTDVGQSEQELLEAELARLDDELATLRRLLKQLPDDPELRSAIAAIEAHLTRLSARWRDVPPMIHVDAPDWAATR